MTTDARRISIHGRLLISLALSVGLSTSAAGSDQTLNDIYRLFFETPVSVERIGERYRDDIIHVGRPDTPLIVGKPEFMEVNIATLAEMVNSGQLKFAGTAYVVRRIVSGDMANDVGYLHSRITLPNGQTLEQVQKYSWVFIKEDGVWRVITDFDATSAPLAVLDGLDAEIVVN